MIAVIHVRKDPTKTRRGITTNDATTVAVYRRSYYNNSVYITVVNNNFIY